MNTVFYKKSLLTLLVFVGISLKMIAQRVEEGNFVYSDGSKTEIVGLTESGMGANELEIPATVTSVAVDAFVDAKTSDGGLTTLTIKGNPEFGNNVLSAVKSTLTSIDAGKNMSSTNIEKMLRSLGTGNNLSTLEIDGYTDANAEIDWDDETGMTDILTSEVRVFMPAGIVNTQIFGDAAVYGSFTLTGEFGTFCAQATFKDDDMGSNFLFYVPVSVDTSNKQIHFERVLYILAGQGVLMHNTSGSANTVFLPRVYTDLTYSTNMFKGVTEQTEIGETETNEKGEECVNMVLYQGLFHPTSRGMLPANRAYLRVPTATYNALHGAPLRFTYINEETTGIQSVDNGQKATNNGQWYTISGQRLFARPSTSGLYIYNGHTVVVK